MVGTFGQQLAQQQQDQRLSRTQRVIRAEQDAQARREFLALQEKAQQLQQTEFANLTFEQYTEKYNQLPTDIKQFFLSPEQITTERNARIVVEKQKYQAEITNLQAQLQQLIATRDKYIADHENNSSEWWSRNRKSYEKRIDDYNMDIREKEETINYSSGEAGKIDQGATANDVINYGEDKADYNRRRREARSDRREEFSKKVKTGSLDEDLKKLGLDPKNVNFSKYQSAVSEYNKKAEYNNQLITWSEKVGFENLPAFAQEKINPSAVEWQKANPTEKLQFDKRGNVIGVSSAIFKEDNIALWRYNEMVKTQSDKYDKLSTMDTTLKLGEAPKNYAVMSSGENAKPFTQEQIRLNEYYSKPYLQQAMEGVKIFWQRLTGTEDQVETSNVPQMEWVTNTTASEGVGGKGTVTTTTQLTPESNLYYNEIGEFNLDADKLSEEIFADYEKKIEALSPEDTTIENIQKIKTEEQKKFTDEIAIYSGSFEKDYAEGMKQISRNKIGIMDAIPFYTPLKKFYYNLEDKDIAGRSPSTMHLSKDETGYTYPIGWTTTTTSPEGISRGGTLLSKTTGSYNLDYSPLSENDFSGAYTLNKKWYSPPSQSAMAEHTLKDYSYYRNKGMPQWLSRELASGEAFGKGTYYGIASAIAENPRTFLFKVGVTAGVIGGVTAVVTYSGGMGALAGSLAVKTVSTALTTIWAGSVIVRTAYGGNDAYTRGLALGEIVGKEITPILGGGYLGIKIAGLGIKGWENLKTFGQNPKKIAEYKRVRMEVLKAEQTFPTAPKSKHLSEFQKSKFSLLTDEKGTRVRVTRKFKVIDQDLKTAGYKNYKELRVDATNGIIRFNKRMNLSAVEKLRLLKNYFGEGYSVKLAKGQFSLTKYLPKEAWNKLGLSAGSHATTSGRFANVGERYTASAGSSELPVQHFSSEDSLYFALGKTQSPSLYGGSILGSAVPKPYIEALRSKGFDKVPKNFKPRMTKLEVVQWLKENAPNYPTKWVVKDYWKQASYFIEKGRTGELTVILKKSEIEAGKDIFGVAERTPQKPYYVRVKSPEIYKDLTEIKRMGKTEYVWQVKPLNIKEMILMRTKEINFFGKRLGSYSYPAVNPILKYRLWDRIVPNIRGGELKFGKPVGSFKSMDFGKVIPIERYKSIPATRLEQQAYKESLNTFLKKVRTQDLQKNIKIINKRYDQLMKGKLELPEQHGVAHLTRVRENINKLIDVYPELHPELIARYGSLKVAKVELGKSALFHDLGRGLGSHGDTLANVLSSGKFAGGTVNKRLIEAIRLHDVTYGAKSVETKLLSTADRLDLTRFGIKVKPKLLPLTDAQQRLALNVKIKEISLINENSLIGSSGRMKSSPYSYADEYAYMISFPKSSKSIQKPSYQKSYSSDLKSSIKSLISSSISSASKISRSSGSSVGSYSPFSYEPYSYNGYKGASYISTPPYSPKPYPKVSWLVAERIEKKKQKKFKPTPEFEALFPDFTARSIGLAPKKVKSVEQAMREISKLRTGFEIRTGARMSGYSPIDEKSLMMGIMK